MQRLLASGFSTGEKHGGYIDSLGIDENGTLEIVEYRLTSSEKVMNQALYHLDWLVGHGGRFRSSRTKEVCRRPKHRPDCTSLLCIPDSFSKDNTYLVQQMGRNIQLVQYKLFQGD